MNEDVFNTSLRGFLKKVGITSQREIEKAVRDARRQRQAQGQREAAGQDDADARRRQFHARDFRRDRVGLSERATFFPSPLVGEGGRDASVKTGEGSLSTARFR